ncbi:MAG TPA: S9 family peptidase, partial [Flavobacteriaceae bacterium]|nr:S9 family peptidase [Flavobacteriaceae bacterium]
MANILFLQPYRNFNGMIEKEIFPPRAEKIPTKLEIHNDVRIDNYYWLNQRDNPKVIDYLNEENTYFNAKTAHLKAFEEDLFHEMKSRIKEDDQSVPYIKNGYYYITRFEKGLQYPIHSRKKGSLDGVEDIMFDVNKLAEGHNYYRLVGVSVSPNNKLVSFGVDTFSRRQYKLQFKNLETGELYPEVIENTTGSACWASDNKTVFYTRKNPTTLRSESVFKHVLGTDPSEDLQVYFEEDETFNVYVYRSKSDEYIILGCHSTVSTEYHTLAANNPDGNFKLFQKRERDLEYNIAHYNNHFYILTNKDKATNFKLMKTSEATTSKEHWFDVIPHRANVLLEDISIFKDFLVVEERTEGLAKIRIIRWDDSEDFYIPFSEEAYAAGVYYNPEFNTNTIRYGYNSLTTPNTVLDFNVVTKTKEVKKQQEVLGGTFKPENYKSERHWATAQDGTKIPVSLVYNKTTKISKKTPLVLYGYGSYGYTIDAGFSSTRLSLLDRGFVFAIAHVRGSEYLGRKWYEEGKLLKKKNTFTDFIDCAKYLVEKNYTTPKHLYASGGSAGGLLVGAVANMAPQLFNGIIASVPFVDVVTTMLDDSIPLTTGEYDEWGNPNQEKYYNYMK